MQLPMRRWFTNILFRYKTAAWVTWAVVVFLLHAFPGEYIPSLSWAEWLALDKWIHAFMFGSGVLVFKYHRVNRFALVFGLIAYASFLEWFQLTLASDRSFDFVDLLADGVGITIGLTIF